MLTIGRHTKPQSEHIGLTSENPREKCADLQSVEVMGGKEKEKANIASIFFRNCQMKNMMPTLVKDEEKEESHLRKVKEGRRTLQVVMVRL